MNLARQKEQLPAGFSFSALAAGIKASGRPDLALVGAAQGTTAAALFTANLVAAAPVQIGRKHLAACQGRVRALIVNSGNANCATGNSGLRDCQNVCQAVARSLGIASEQVIPSSTGIIGVALPTTKILKNISSLVADRQPTPSGLHQFAQAIMTTDTRQKTAAAAFRSGRSEVKLVGVAKGAGMIHPQLATMLVYLFTDLKASSPQLRKALQRSCDLTFNSISIDGDTSTNDTVLLLASGQSRVRYGDAGVPPKFSAALLQVCRSLAEQIVADGEGVQHVIRLHIEQARSRPEALQIARTIAHSLLVKAAWAGADPNWGRILAAIGRSGVNLDPTRIKIFIGDQEVCRQGMLRKFNEARAHHDLSRSTCKIRVLLGRGKAMATFLTSDLSAEYVRINADYST